MDNEIRKTGSDLTTSDLAASVQKRPEPAVPDSQLPKTQPGDNRSSQYGTATAPAREKKSHRYLLLMNHRTCAPVGTPSNRQRPFKHVTLLRVPKRRPPRAKLSGHSSSRCALSFR